jgi:hypothetical protein
MQMTRGMRLEQAKQHVAERLGVSVLDLCDPLAMHDVRRELGLGLIPVQELTYPSEPGAIEAKFHIAEVLDVPINCVRQFSDRVAPRAGTRPGRTAPRGDARPAAAATSRREVPA